MGKKIIIGVLGVAVIILSGAFLTPHFINWNEYKTDIAAKVKSATGRNISIGGDLNVRILPTPALTVNNFSIANIAGATNPEMVKLDALQVRVALLPLLSGELQIERILLKNPIINIEKLADGRVSWDFNTSPTKQSSVTASTDNTASTDADIRLDHFEISNATIVYIDSSTAKPSTQKIENLDAFLRAESISGPFAGNGKARFLGVPISFDVSSGLVIEGRTIPVNISLLAPGESRINVSGAVIGMGDDPHYKGKAEIYSSRLSELINALARSSVAPAQLSGPFSLTTLIDVSASAAKLEELEISIGEKNENRASGALSLGMDNGIQFALDLKAGKINLDQILKSTSNGNRQTKNDDVALSKSPPTAATNAGSENAKSGFEIPANISGKVSIKIAQMMLKGDNLSDIQLKSNIANGVIAVEKISAELPGVTGVNIDGSARARDGGLVFDGNASVISSKPQDFANWIGLSVNDGVIERVRQVSYKSNVSLNSELLSLAGIDISIDRSRITGGVSLALNKRLSFGANLNVDSINLDSYLKKTASASSVATKKSQTQSTTAIADVASAWSVLRALNDFDANTKLKIGVLTQNGNVYKNLSLDGTLYAGTLEIRDARLGSFAGSSGALKGKINGFGGVPEMTGVSFSLATNDAATLSRRLGVASVPAKIGAAKVNAKIDGSLLKPKMDISVKSMGGNISANGGLSLLPFSFGFDGNVAIKHPKPTQIFSVLGLSYFPKGPIKGMDLGFALKTDGKEHNISKISGTLDGTSLAGNVNVTTGGSKTNILASMQTGDLYIEHFMPKEGGSKSAERKRKLMPGVVLASWNQPDNQLGQPVEIAQSPSRANKRWSRDNIDLSVLNTINADVTLTSSSVFYGKHKLNNVDIHALVKDGVLLADRINAIAYGGPVKGTAVVQASGKPTMDAKIKINGLDVGAALMAASNQSGVKGGLDLDLGFMAQGKSAAELVSSLSGAGGLNISGLDVKQAGKGNALSGVIGLDAAMNQFAIPMPGASGGPNNGLAEVKVKFDIKDGLATLGQATISSKMGNGNARGTVDIAGWGMDVSGLMSVEANLLTALLSKGKIGRQEVPFTLKGALDAPKVNFGVRPAAAGVNPADTVQPAPQKQLSPQQLLLDKIFKPKQAAPAPEQQPQQQPQQQPEQQPRQVKPKELIIRGIMDGLFNK